MLATDGTWPEADGGGGDWRRAVVAALIVSLVLALSVAIFMLMRRLSGAFESQLAVVPLAVTAVALATWACAVRFQLSDRRVDWLLAALLLLFAVAISFPGNRAVDWLVWLAVFTVFGRLPARRSSPAVGSDKRAERVVQQFTRSRATDGCEAIRGLIVAELAAGERTAIQHIAFCPPFERLPSVEAEVVDGPGCDLKIAQILHQGARFEVRLSRASTAAERVTIEIMVTDSPPLAV